MKDNSWAEYLQNPKTIALKKFMVEILYTKYHAYEDLLTRLGSQLITENDLHSFGKMINDVYELGYKKAVDDYKEQLAKMGIAVNIKKSSDDNQ